MTVRVSLTDERIDPAEQAAQRVTEALADLLTEAKLTNNYERVRAIWELARLIEREAARVNDAVADRAYQLCSDGYGHGV